MREAILSVVLLLANVPSAGFSQDKPGAAGASPSWSRFRGPNGSGVAAESDMPVEFGVARNVVWKLPLPPGHSSPSLSGDRIFLTGYSDGWLETLCVDRAGGKILWTGRVKPGKLERGSRLSSPAASTPTADPERVYVYFGSYGLVTYEKDGREVWRKPLPTPITQHGASTSPVLCGDRLVLACDQDVGSHILAVDAQSGKTIWRTDRPGFRRGFSTPLAWPGEKPRVVILAGTLRLVAYDLVDGAERWVAHGLPNEMVSSPVSGDGLIFAAGWTYGSGVSQMPAFADLLAKGDENKDGKLTRQEAPSGPAKQHFIYIDADKDGQITRVEWDSMAAIFGAAKNSLIAVRPGGRGDVTKSHVKWTQKRGLPYVPSPLYYRGRVYLVKKGGIATSFDAKTGAIVFQGRLGALGNYYASPVAAGGKICCASQQGVAVVFEAGDELRVLARNDLEESILATPAIVDDTLYVRTARHLYAFRAAAPKRQRE